jgi:arginyl-tRNA synthetase
VEVQNYIDDTGVQVATSSSDSTSRRQDARRDPSSIADTTRFDYYCWDLYARVTEWYDEDKERLKIRANTLHDIEHGGNENAEIAGSSPIASSVAICARWHG